MGASPTRRRRTITSDCKNALPLRRMLKAQPPDRSTSFRDSKWAFQGGLLQLVCFDWRWVFILSSFPPQLRRPLRCKDQQAASVCIHPNKIIFLKKRGFVVFLMQISRCQWHHLQIHAAAPHKTKLSRSA